MVTLVCLDDGVPHNLIVPSETALPEFLSKQEGGLLVFFPSCLWSVSSLGEQKCFGRSSQTASYIHSSEMTDPPWIHHLQWGHSPDSKWSHIQTRDVWNSSCFLSLKQMLTISKSCCLHGASRRLFSDESQRQWVENQPKQERTLSQLFSDHFGHLWKWIQAQSSPCRGECPEFKTEH